MDHSASEHFHVSNPWMFPLGIFDCFFLSNSEKDYDKRILFKQ